MLKPQYISQTHFCTQHHPTKYMASKLLSVPSIFRVEQQRRSKLEIRDRMALEQSSKKTADCQQLSAPLNSSNIKQSSEQSTEAWQQNLAHAQSARWSEHTCQCGVVLSSKILWGRYPADFFGQFLHLLVDVVDLSLNLTVISLGRWWSMSSGFAFQRFWNCSCVVPKLRGAPVSVLRALHEEPWQLLLWKGSASVHESHFRKDSLPPLPQCESTSKTPSVPSYHVSTVMKLSSLVWMK